jgi:hypothetical protein
MLVDSSTQAIEDVVDSLVRRVEAVRGIATL